MSRIWPVPECIATIDADDRVLATRTVLERASRALGRPVVAASRGGASDASHFASSIPVTIDGLGPRGGKAHNPEEFVLEASLLPRAQVALAVILAALEG